MGSRLALRFPRLTVSPALLAAQEHCQSVRERSWALRGLSEFQRADVARLLKQSNALFARSRRLHVKLVG